MAKLKKRISPLDLDQIIDYKDLSLLRSFTTDYGKIVSRRTTGVTRKQQNKIKKAIKKARILGLFPFVAKKSL
jgi:small subunit ribosomal protein S18